MYRKSRRRHDDDGLFPWDPPGGFCADSVHVLFSWLCLTCSLCTHSLPQTSQPTNWVSSSFGFTRPEIENPEAEMAGDEEGRSLFSTPTWAVATVVTFMVVIGFLIQYSLQLFGKWLDKTKRKALMAALVKIKEELMLFGVLSLLMGHWIVVVAKICVKSSALSRKFYPCPIPRDRVDLSVHFSISVARYLNESVPVQKDARHLASCPEGHESFASKESLEQLHRFLFVLGVTHISYSFVAIALAMIKIYSWRTWENLAKEMGNDALEGSPQQAMSRNLKLRRLSTFIFHNTSHPWSQHKVLVWLLCFSRQLWSSINQADYMALRLGFITTHQLPLSYDFLNYMLRSMEEEFRDIVGISVPLWIYTIFCILLDFHGTNLYFYLSFLPAINAFEMANFLWSLWEIKEPSCFMENRSFLAIRLAFGIMAQFWCSYITFPLYIIVTQMGSRYKKTIVTENVRASLHGWQRRGRTRHGRKSAARTLSMDRESAMRARTSLGVIEKLSLRQCGSRRQSQMAGDDPEVEASVSGNDNDGDDDHQIKMVGLADCFNDVKFSGYSSSS